MKIATWNINSVRLRKALVCEFLQEAEPDVLCLQETKSPEDKIPYEDFAALGYNHHVARGFKGYNGVLILSKLPFEGDAFNMLERNDARHVSAKFENGFTLHNFYVPAGGDEPDPEVNEKFRHKLDFLAEMKARFSAQPEKSILVGDLNIAPLEDDVWSHKQLLKVVSHTPVEVETLEDMMQSGGWVDSVRQLVPEGKLYSWWSYRARDWAESNRGRRLDHIWFTKDIADVPKTVKHFDAYRGKQQPSDHIPVMVEL